MIIKKRDYTQVTLIVMHFGNEKQYKKKKRKRKTG